MIDFQLFPKYYMFRHTTQLWFFFHFSQRPPFLWVLRVLFSNNILSNVLGISWQLNFSSLSSFSFQILSEYSCQFLLPLGAYSLGKSMFWSAIAFFFAKKLNRVLCPWQSCKRPISKVSSVLLCIFSPLSFHFEF